MGTQPGHHSIGKTANSSKMCKDEQLNWHLPWRTYPMRTDWDHWTCRARGDVIQIYKHVKELYNIQARYIKIDPHETRGHKFRLRKDRVTKKVRQNFLTERAANTWNRLPPEVVEAPSLNSFKARIDKLWKKHRYNQRSIHEQYSYLTHTERPNLVTGY